MNNKWGWVKDAVPIFILACFTLLFFSDVLFGNKIFIHRDLLRFFYPLREFSVSQFQRGQTPLWNPYIHCGTPHLARLQTCVFYPLSIIYLLFPFPQAFNYFIILHIFLAGIFTYILMREWRYSRYASFFSGAVFMFSGYIISVINLLASLGSVVWLPLVILFYEKALKKDWIKNSVITGIFMSLMLLGGEPAILYATVFILLILSPWQRLGPLAIALLVTLGLCCFQILPFMEFLRHSSRGAMGFDEASMWSLPPYALLDLFVPYLTETDYLYKDYWSRQSWLLVYYMGLLTVICAFISLKFNTSKRRKAFFYILALGLILSFGRYTPLYYFLYKFIPGFSLSRYPIKFFFIVAFSLAILAGMGLDYYIRFVKSSTSLARFLKKILIFGFVSAFFYLIINLNFSEIVGFLYNRISPYFMDKKEQLGQLIYVAIFNIKRAVGYFMIFSCIMFFGLHKKIRLNLIVPILLFLSLLDIYTANKRLYLNMDIDRYLRPGRTIEFLKKDKSLFRIFDSPATLSQNTYVPERDYFEGVNSLKERMVSDRGVSFGIYDAYGYSSLYNKRHEEVIMAITKLDSPDEANLLNLLNVKYVISSKKFEAKRYRLVKKGGKANIYENENVLPRAFLVDRAIVIKNEKKILEKMKDKHFEPSEELILEEDFFSTNDEGRRADGESVNILHYPPNEVLIEANVSKSKFLVLSDSYYPGWEAFVDGKRTKIYRADYILRAVHLKPGKHIVKFTYRPFSFKIGALVTFGTIFILMYAVAFRQD